MAFHISDKDGQPRPCKAASPATCPVGGEHFADKEKAQGAADEKLASEYSVTNTLSKKPKGVDFTKRAPMESFDDGSYPIAAGEYYIVSSESLNFEDDEYDEAHEELVNAVTTPGDGTDRRDKAMIGALIDGEPVYTAMDHESGISNSFVTPKVYKALVAAGMKYDAMWGGKPPSVVVFKEDTTLGSVGSTGDDEDDPDYDYGWLEVGDQRIDLFNAENSLMHAGRTVIGEDQVPTKPAKEIDFSKVEPMTPAKNYWPKGHYVLPSGIYYAINSESMETANTKELKAIENAILDPTNGADTAANKMRGGYINGEPVFSVREGWSGVTNSLVTPKVYKALVSKGLIKADKKPPIVQVAGATSLGAVDGNPSEDNPNYGMMEVNKEKIDLFNGENSLVRSERTVIDSYKY
jgi:hypothetical protein